MINFWHGTDKNSTRTKLFVLGKKVLLRPVYTTLNFGTHAYQIYSWSGTDKGIPHFFENVGKMHKLDQLFEEMLLARNKKLYTIYKATIEQLETRPKNDVTTVAIAATMMIQCDRYFGF
jgi:hypothetical protein